MNSFCKVSCIFKAYLFNRDFPRLSGLCTIHSPKNDENIDFPFFSLNYTSLSLVHSYEAS